MLVCRRCDGQGFIKKAEVVGSGTLIFVCDECEATWLSADALASGSWTDFESYMAQLGKSGSWDEITILDDL